MWRDVIITWTNMLVNLEKLLEDMRVLELGVPVKDILSADASLTTYHTFMVAFVSFICLHVKNKNFFNKNKYNSELIMKHTLYTLHQPMNDALQVSLEQIAPVCDHLGIRVAGDALGREQIRAKAQPRHVRLQRGKLPEPPPHPPSLARRHHVNNIDLRRREARMYSDVFMHLCTT